MPATGVRPPFLTFVAVRAIAPVAGMPPKRPAAMFAMPWPTSSTLDLCRLPIMPSATTAESSDSIAAEQRDGDGRREELAHPVERDGRQARSRDRRVDLAEARADRLDGKAERRDGGRRGEDRDDRARHLARDPRPEQQDRERPGGDADRGQRRGAEVRGVRLPLREEVRGHGAHAEAEQVLDLRREDDHRDPAREAGDDGVRDELDRAAEPREAEDDQHAAREERDDRQPVEAVSRARCRRR